MRRTRRLILVAIAALVAAVAVTYTVQKGLQARQAPPPPKRLPDSVSARAADWTWEKTQNGKILVRAWARDFRQNAGNTHTELEGLRLHLFHDDGHSYDRVESDRASFDMLQGLLDLEGNVRLTLGVSGEEAPNSGRLLQIQTVKARYEVNTGRAFTSQPAAFAFERGEGRSTGAEYDPNTKELKMMADVRLNWRGTDPAKLPMEVEAGTLLYKEAESKVFLGPWSKFRRGTLTMNAGDAVVTLFESTIRVVEAASAVGVDDQPSRHLEYAADRLTLNFDERTAMEQITAHENAKLTASDAASITDVKSSAMELFFDPAAPEENTLERAVASGGAEIVSKPAPGRKGPAPDTRVMRSEVVHLVMKANGSELERVHTDVPGTIEFLPNRADSRRRRIEAASMRIDYAAGNVISNYEATMASTVSYPLPKNAKAPPAKTSSAHMKATFAPLTGELQTLEQWDNFRYEEGDQRATANRALLETAQNLITLQGAARVWDASGSTSADTIVLAQSTSQYTAIGNVASMRLPDKAKKATQPGLISNAQPLQARAAKMTSAKDNRLIIYEGGALLWQGPNRLQARKVTIDRQTGVLRAEGTVVSQLVESGGQRKKGSLLTVVRAENLLYEETQSLAHYFDGAEMQRAGTEVKAQEIRAFLKQDDGGSSLDKAVADGTVHIVQAKPASTRTGTSEHAEYYVDEGKVILTGGSPKIVDTREGTTAGKHITFFTESDKLIVEGGTNRPVESRIRRSGGQT
jgi:lipopolysaccharide export system protein LptA